MVQGSGTGRHRLQAMADLFGRLPRLPAVLLGVVCVALGAVLIVRPLVSLSTLVVLIGAGLIVSGVADLFAEKPRARNLGTWAAIAWIAAGIAVLIWPGVTIRALALVVGVALIVAGISKAVGAFRGGAPDERIANGLLALASVVFGVLALSWPDVTLLVVAIIFAARMIWFGINHIVAVRSRGRLRGWARVAGAAAALVIALALAGVGAQLHRGVTVIDDFYTAPASVPAAAGVLIRSETFSREIPDGAKAWRILYTTTRDDSTPALASAIVVAPSDASLAPFPVIAWAHGTTGFSRNSAPSLAPRPFWVGAFMLLDKVIDQGWALVATDYTGLGTTGPHPYLIGQGEGRSVLDAVRAARQLESGSSSGSPAGPLADETVVWGHSQGGHAALWTGVLAPTYAPDVNVMGVAALAPASDIVGLVHNLNVPGGTVFASYVVAAYTQIYPDVSFDTYIRPPARVLVEKMSKRPLSGPSTFLSVLEALSLSAEPNIFAVDPTTGAFGKRLRENVPTGRIEAPLLIGQGLSDPLVLPAVQQGYVEARRAAGQELLYLTYPGRDHVGVVQPDSPLVPDLIAWTQDRFAGRPAPSN